MKYILNFFHMNEIYVLIYAMLNNISFLNLQFNYIPDFHRANFLSLSVKKKIGTVYYKTAKVSPMERWDVILMKVVIALLMAITVI